MATTGVRPSPGAGAVVRSGVVDRAALLARVAASLHRLHRHGDAVFAVLHVCADAERGQPAVAGAEVAAILEEVMWVGDLVSDAGLGQVILCVEDVADEHEAAAIARRVVDAVGAVQPLSVSVGVVVATRDHAHADELLAEAAYAMTAARSSGGGYEFSDAGLRDSAAARVALERSLRLALDRAEFRVAYQPVLRLADGVLTGVEALVRWEHPTRGLVPPAVFIAAAEATNLILPIGRWVLGETCRQLAVWRDMHPEVPLVGSVNLSAAQLADPTLAEDVRLALAESQIDPALLCLEINESVLMADPPEAERALRRLRAEGVQLAIDDFGTGSSSLSWLERFPIDVFKIDRAFVAGLGSSHVDTAVVRAVIGLGSSLGLTVVAEGVETEEQLAMLRAFGCAAAQGYLWSRPAPADEISEMLAAPPSGPVPTSAGSEGPAAAIAEPDVLDLLVHELRTPLTVLNGYAELMDEGMAVGDTSLLRDGLATIRRQVTNIDAMFSTLVDVQALAAGTLSLERERTDVGAFLAEVVADLAMSLPDHDLHLEGAESTGELLIDIDLGRIREVLTNLVGNAAKYSPAGTPIQVVLERSRHEVAVHVVDRGPGVPPDRVGDIFRKFARLDRTVKGTGLGLYIARGISRSHGGELACRPAPGGGADFVLRLPLAEPRA